MKFAEVYLTHLYFEFRKDENPLKKDYNPGIGLSGLASAMNRYDIPTGR
jgi:hypothetical protein